MAFPQKNFRLYAICDEQTCRLHNRQTIDFYRSLIEAGIEIVQYRNKISSARQICNTLQELQAITPNSVTLVVNDQKEAANKLGLALHLGQEDGHPPQNFCCTWGLSTHNRKELQSALTRNPDYIGYGAVFASPTKSHVSKANPSVATELWPKEIVFIGGITLENVTLLPQADRFYYAVISDFFRYGNDLRAVKHYAQDFYACLKKKEL